MLESDDSAASRMPQIRTFSTSRRRSTWRRRWFCGRVAYTMAKFGMSMCTLGMAEELRAAGIAVNSLWPLTTIDTAAVRNLLGWGCGCAFRANPRSSRTRRYAIVQRPSRECTGNFFIDEDVLREAGVTRFLRSTRTTRLHRRSTFSFRTLSLKPEYRRGLLRIIDDHGSVIGKALLFVDAGDCTCPRSSGVTS